MSEVFPRWTNRLPGQILFALLFLLGGIAAGVNYYFTPKYARVGYQPSQPVPFSHAIHSNQLGIDCRYCHDGVEKSWYSNVPSTDTCINCHSEVKSADPRLELVRQSYKESKPIDWVQIHKVPDYVYFNHSAHVNRGVSCVECHGRVDLMEEVYHAKSFSMSFCLDCHREMMPETHLVQRDINGDLKGIHEIAKDNGITIAQLKGFNGYSEDISEKELEKRLLRTGQKINISAGDPNKRLRPLSEITNLSYNRWDDPDFINKNFVAHWHIKTSQNCSACHR